MFATTINACGLVTILASIIVKSGQEVDKLAESHENFFAALKHKMVDKRKQCVVQ